MHTRTMWQRLSAWLVFGVIVSLLPLGFDFLGHVDGDGGNSWTVLAGRGQLLLISVVIAGNALGEVLTAEVPARIRTARIWTAGSLTIGLALQAGWYADIASRLATSAS